MARSHFSYSGSGYVSRGSSNSGATHSYKGTTTYSNGSSRSYTGTITHVGNTYQGTTTYSDGSSRSYNLHFAVNFDFNRFMIGICLLLVTCG